jgi:Asp-tRNA(Asn)/Glu-tRNA(Gln) amidotransferase A subunit family amidase
MAYNPRPVKAPVLSGQMLQFFLWLVRTPLGAPIRKKMLKDLGIFDLRKVTLDDGPLLYPSLPLPPPAEGQPPRLSEVVEASRPQAEFSPETIHDFQKAYQEGRITPTAIAERVLQATGESENSERPLRAFIAQYAEDLMAQAQASDARHRAGNPLGPLDGVPIAVKDELDCVPYPTTLGTSFLGDTAATADAAVVTRLREAGALLIGKANMVEIGIGVTGLNPHHGPARNPHNPGHMTGGSSSGSAVAVAAGLCPASVGADGGGSIRIPASFCGLVGLKPTFGRISEVGVAPLCWSLAHLGPLASTARDAAVLYRVLAGPDPEDPHTLHQPDPHLVGFGQSDLQGQRIGIYPDFFHHARPEVVERGQSMIKHLESAGAELVEIEIQDLDMIRIAHAVTITSEMVSSHQKNFGEHLKDYSLETQLKFMLVSALGSADYATAQRVRASATRQFEALFKEVDMIATPATGTSAPAIPEHAVTTDESNLVLLDEIMRFCPLANLLGLPAISFPSGYTEDGLPTALQLIGRPWEEHRLLAAAHIGEAAVEKRKPEVHFSLLG